MKTYNFNKLTYGGEEKISIVVPDDVKFYIYDKYNDHQQFIMFVTYYDKKLYNKLYDANSKYMYCININKLGNLIIGHLHNVQPLDELPYINLDELNNIYKDDLNNIYIELYKYIDSDINIPMGELFNDEFVTTTPIDFILPKKINIETYHLKEFLPYHADNGEPCILISTVSYNNWLYDNEENIISINKISLHRLLNAFHHDYTIKIISKENTIDEINESKEKFKNRITEIINKL